MPSSGTHSFSFHVFLPKRWRRDHSLLFKEGWEDGCLGRCSGSLQGLERSQWVIRPRRETRPISESFSPLRPADFLGSFQLYLNTSVMLSPWLTTGSLGLTAAWSPLESSSEGSASRRKILNSELPPHWLFHRLSTSGIVRCNAGVDFHVPIWMPSPLEQGLMTYFVFLFSP